MKYSKPKAEVIIFDNSDVITASGCLSLNVGDQYGGECKHRDPGSGEVCWLVWTGESRDDGKKCKYALSTTVCKAGYAGAYSLKPEEYDM